MSFITQIPSFVLRGIDPKVVLTRYLSGEFSGLSFQPGNLSKIPTKVTTVNILPLQTSTIHDALYVYRDRSEKIRHRVFSGQKAYESYMKGEKTEIECENCGRMYNSLDISGIPVKRSEIVVDAYLIPLLYTEGSYCKTKCAYTGWHEYQRVSYTFRDSALKNAEIWLREMYAKECPGKVLEITNDRRLLKRFGGSLDYDEWDTDKYVKIPGINIIPTKGIYAKQT